MSKQWNRYHLIILCVVLALITTACFRDSGENVPSQPISQLIESETPIPTVEPTETPTPSPTATPEDSEETEEPTDEIVNIGNTVPGGTEVAQGPTAEPIQEQPDDFALTATALIGQLTQDAALVLTTQAFEAGIGTTPTPIATITFDPLLVTATDIPQQSLPPGVDCVHQIRVGENLYQLSLAYGVSVGDMATASGITNWNIVLVGQRITIPGCGTTGFVPPATSVPIPSSTPVVAAQALPGTGTTTTTTTTTTNSLAAQAQSAIVANAQADLQANAAVTSGTPLVGSRQYTVLQYDTLFQIAQAHGTTVDAIAALNGITNINSITMGDVLQIP